MQYLVVMMIGLVMAGSVKSQINLCSFATPLQIYCSGVDAGASPCSQVANIQLACKALPAFQQMLCAMNPALCTLITDCEPVCSSDQGTAASCNLDLASVEACCAKVTAELPSLCPTN